MHRVDGSTAVAVLPTAAAVGTPGYYSNTNRTIVDADQLNAIQEEIAGVVVAAGLTLDKTDNTQLLDAVKEIGGSNRVWASYQKDATQSIDASSETVIDFDLKYIDEPGDDRVVTGSGWNFPAAGARRVRVSAHVGAESVEWTAGNIAVLRARGYILGPPPGYIPVYTSVELARIVVEATAVNALSLGGSANILPQGFGNLQITLEHNRTGGAVALTDPERCYVDIEEF